MENMKRNNFIAGTNTNDKQISQLTAFGTPVSALNTIMTAL